MKATYKVNIVSPEKLIFYDENIEEVVLPSYEGDMGVLVDHISIISFLKPGIIKISNPSKNVNTFFVEDGIIEFSNNSLTILSSKIIATKDLNKKNIEELILETENVLKDTKINDNNKYLANHKLDTLRSISVN